MAGLAIDNPVTLTQALASQRVIPGDVLELADGTYAGAYVSAMAGTQAKPIIIHPKHPGSVVIDGSLTINGVYTNWLDLNFTDSAEDRTIITPGITIGAVGTAIIGCKIEKMRSSGINWFGSGVGSVLECWFSDNGYTADDGRHGHHVYTHNNGGGLRRIELNLFDTTASYGLHVYSGGENKLRDYQILDNVHNSATNVGGGLGLADLVFERNIQYGHWLYLGKYKVEGGVDENCVASDNIVIDTSNIIISDPETFTFADNLVYTDDANPTLPDGWTKTEKPATLSYFIPFTLSARWSGIQVDYVSATKVFTAVLVEKT